MTTNQFANFISRLFGPFSVLPMVVAYLLFFQADLSIGQRIEIGKILGITYLVLPAILFYYLWTKHKITDIDITDRKQRNQWMNWVVISWWIGLLAITAIHDLPPLFFQHLVLVNLVMTLITIITEWFKVSIHVAGFLVVYLILNDLFGWVFWWVIVALPVVGWARWQLKKHTIAQLLLGILVPVLVFGVLRFGLNW